MRNSPKSHILQISTHLAPVADANSEFADANSVFADANSEFADANSEFADASPCKSGIGGHRGGDRRIAPKVSPGGHFGGVLPDRIEPEQDMEIDAKAFRFGSCWEAPSPPPPRKLPGSSPSPGKLLGSYPFPATSCGQVKPPLPSHKLRTYAATLRIHLLADWNLLINSCFCSVAVRGRCCWGRRAFQS